MVVFTAIRPPWSSTAAAASCTKTAVDCIKEGKPPPLDFEAGHQAAVCCHLANIAYLGGCQLAWNGQTETIAGDEQASAWLSRPRRRGYELPSV